jgi:hypothetical protein
MIEHDDQFKRLFVLHSFMATCPNLKNVILIENDVLLYYCCDDSLNTLMFDERQIYIPFDAFDRPIFSIIYIPNAIILGKVLSQNNIFTKIGCTEKLINTLPIFVGKDCDNFERNFVTKGFANFGYLFDGVAMGQYVCGTDIRNNCCCNPVYETCIIKYPDEGKIGWRLVEGFKKPFFKLSSSGKEIPIFNLHIECKKLKLYC